MHSSKTSSTVRVRPATVSARPGQPATAASASGEFALTARTSTWRFSSGPAAGAPGHAARHARHPTQFFSFHSSCGARAWLSGLEHQ